MGDSSGKAGGMRGWEVIYQNKRNRVSVIEALHVMELLAFD